VLATFFAVCSNPRLCILRFLSFSVFDCGCFVVLYRFSDYFSVVEAVVVDVVTNEMLGYLHNFAVHSDLFVLSASNCIIGI